MGRGNKTIAKRKNWRETLLENKKKKTVVSTIDPVLTEEAPVSSKLENRVASTINGFNESSFLNSTLF